MEAAVDQTPSSGADQAQIETTEVKDTSSDKPKYKVKVDGQELEVDQDELLKGYQTNKSATKRSQEAAALRKETDALRAEIEQDKKQLAGFFSNIKGNPDQIFDMLQQLGHDPDEIAMRRAYKKVEYERMNPEQREAHDAKKKLQEYELSIKERDDKLKKYEQSAEEQKNQEISARFEQEIEDDVLAVVAEAKANIKPKVVARIAEIYEDYLNKYGKKPDRKLVAEMLRHRYDQDISEYLTRPVEDLDQFVETLPKEFLSKLQDYFVRKAKKPLPLGTPSGIAPSKSSPKQKPKLQTIDDFFKNLGE